MKDEIIIADNTLYNDAAELIKYARKTVANQINAVEILTNYTLGKWIVDEQQKGSERAAYGKTIIKRMSEILTAEFGKGFSKSNLENARKFYLTYKNRIDETLFRQFAVEKTQTVFG